MRVLTYDVEISKPISALKDGWDGAKRGDAGVASVVLYDTDSARYHLYDTHNIIECVSHLNQADLIVGFNSIEFDTPCLEGFTKQRITPQQIDLLHIIWKAIGEKHKGYGLGPICKRTFGLDKNGAGESAPQLKYQGRWAELFDYNLNDVFLTRTLCNHMSSEGYIIDVEGNELPVDMPEIDA